MALISCIVIEALIFGKIPNVNGPKTKKSPCEKELKKFSIGLFCNSLYKYS
jgi:hypothetical protein